MIGKLRSLASKVQNLVPRPTPAAKRPMQVADGFAVGSRQDVVRASGPKVLQGMAVGAGRSLGEALVASSLTADERASYQSAMEELSGAPEAQTYVKRAFQDGKLAKLMGKDPGADLLDQLDALVEQGRRYAQLPADVRAAFDARMEAAADDLEGQQQLRQQLTARPGETQPPGFAAVAPRRNGSNEGSLGDPYDPVDDPENLKQQVERLEGAIATRGGLVVGEGVAAHAQRVTGPDSSPESPEAPRGPGDLGPGLPPELEGKGDPGGSLDDSLHGDGSRFA